MTEPRKGVLILQHIQCEPAAVYEDVLRARGVPVCVVEVDAGEALPDWRDFEAVIAMGGPMGSYEDANYSWLTSEKRFIGELASAGTPYWGVCLGAQLLAEALGARVYPGPEPEVGMGLVSCTPSAKQDPVFSRAPSSFDSFQWHGDTFELPAGASLLASSSKYPHQAFVWRKAYGLQFHLEVTPALAAEWSLVPAYQGALEASLGPGAFSKVFEDLERDASATNVLAERLFGAWLEAVAFMGLSTST